jgi:hypothetical protein
MPRNRLPIKTTPQKAEGTKEDHWDFCMRETRTSQQVVQLPHSYMMIMNWKGVEGSILDQVLTQHSPGATEETGE